MQLLKKILGSILVAVSLCFLTWANLEAKEKEPVVRMAKIVVKPGLLDAFLAAVTEEMRASLQAEAGVLALYCVAEKDHPEKLIFFEIYQSEEAYLAHRETPHFKKYIQLTKDLTSSKELIETVPVELQDKWQKLK
ncbi:MAG: antibiotic biosynthesis monooxygenase [Desulfovibrio sp.]|nr:antibiotic biosynthesis monooxygenase [Desulfovibrio sp.]